ncbi:MAG: hypothetical protein DRH37_01260 [Deltaproteobacteria bacterium]|nr:MAG: hypothetical protein DRH37_01260 [Deltaproteobacteria bacterium]
MLGIEINRLMRSFLQNPARVSILGFALLIGTGMSLLMLPQASSGLPIGWVNALFTATSATCVTGLTVVDTARGVSPFGQIVILALIQAGGLGIMTISTLFLLMAGRRPSLVGRVVIRDTLTHGEERSVYSVLRDVALFTFVLEGLGTVLMFSRFLPHHEAGPALYLSVFHSVSAFCNAGFSLFSNSLESYRNDWLLNLTTCFLIVMGGIGFLVLSELRRTIPFRPRKLSRLSLHSKLVLTTTVIIVLFSGVLFILLEWHNTLSRLSVADRCLAGFFQVISARTAGFNTLPIMNMTNETLFLLIMLMFIGASPGSCGGGIKTTTFASLVILGISRLRGHTRPRLFRRTISRESTEKAVSVVMVSIVVVLAATMALLVTDVGQVSHPLSRGKFLEILFEVISAFGTVGLSTGITGTLSVWGKLIITLVMFIGRLGPLVIALAVSPGNKPAFYYAEENIMIG